MNPAMWAASRHPASVGRLQDWGLRFIPVGAGRTACGEVGEGRLAEPDAIVAAVEAAVARPARRLRILVTSGGTAEPIDGVRVLTNSSTGRTGAGLAAHFVRRGHEVVLLRSRAIPPRRRRGVRRGGLLHLCGTRRRAHALAGGPGLRRRGSRCGGRRFSASAPSAGTGSRSRPGAPSWIPISPLRLDLLPNPKLVESLRARSRNPALCVVAFKLTQDASPAEARAAVDALLAAADADFVVHNDTGRRNGPPEAFPADIYRRGELPPSPAPPAPNSRPPWRRS